MHTYIWAYQPEIINHKSITLGKARQSCDFCVVLFVYNSVQQCCVMRLTSMKRKGSFSCMRLSMPQRTSCRRAWSWQILEMFFWITGPLVSQWVCVQSRNLIMKCCTLAFISSPSLVKHCSVSSLNFWMKDPRGNENNTSAEQHDLRKKYTTHWKENSQIYSSNCK